MKDYFMRNIMECVLSYLLITSEGKTHGKEKG
jgi:hypothetical protein